MLYLVATPIGNLEDITLRALRILREVSLIAAEDTRHTGKLLKHYDITTPLVSYHEYSNPQRVSHLLDQLATADVALVSDAGMPGLSDPGYKLVEAAVQAGIPVSPIPGATAAISALVSSGLPTDTFLFVGFLPAKSSGRQTALRDIANLPHTLVFYEAPHRLLEMLADVQAVLGDRPVAVARELTKLYEEIWRGTVSAAHTYFGAQERIRGELTVVVGGAVQTADIWPEQAVRDALQALLGQGLSRKEAAVQIATQSGWRKNTIYDLGLT
ncbi:MAG: 16S rRNA (cytidine(1402)-2'-O)-methyltransferase [Chloroflexi bacterium]|nr:16S rRNA (cytidine(1402)-2'-O)-methyltransferase [Chloroflexota bacterium]